MSPSPTLHDEVIHSYLIHTTIRGLIDPLYELGAAEIAARIQTDLDIIRLIRSTRYLNPRTHVPRNNPSSLDLVWEYMADPAQHERFQHMLRVSPFVFQVLVELIKDHPIFHNNSNNPQAPVETQLAVTLFRMGRFGNAASLEDIAREAGCSEGTVELYTERCFTAILSLHDTFVRPLTEEEKEREKEWIDEHVGFKGLWREGWVMYDGTIVVLYARPGFDGDAYYTRKCNYGLNLQVFISHSLPAFIYELYQVGNVPSNLRVVDYSLGFTGSIHDATAFEHTAAALHPNWMFKGSEFAWMDSAYPLSKHTIPVHKKPASLKCENAIFDRMVSHLHVRSEHCMGALKGE